MSNPIPAPDTPHAPLPANSSAQAAATKSNLITTQARSLATLLTDVPEVSARMMKGIVTAVDFTSNPPVLSMQLGGDTTTTITAVRFLDSYSPVVGDTCIILKQGPDVLALGQVADVGTESENGWNAPSLNSGFSAGLDTPYYRLVVDHGHKKIQLRGRVNIATFGTGVMWTMPAGFRPVLDIGPIPVGRDSTGSNAVLLTAGATGTGTMTLSGGGVGVSPGGTTGGSTTGTTNTAHKHRSSDHPSGTNNPNDIVFTAHWTDYIATSFVGTNGNEHNHTTPGHVHTTTNPTFVNLNGVEYFI